MDKIQITNDIINGLQGKETELLQKLGRAEAKRKQLEAKRKMLTRAEESNRIHKMIVLGGTIWAAFRNHLNIDDVENLELLHRDDDFFVTLGKNVFKEYSDSV